MKSIGHKCKKFGPLSELLAPLGVPNWLRACGDRRGKDVKNQHANGTQFKKNCSVLCLVAHLDLYGIAGLMIIMNHSQGER